MCGAEPQAEHTSEANNTMAWLGLNLFKYIKGYPPRFMVNFNRLLKPKVVWTVPDRRTEVEKAKVQSFVWVVSILLSSVH